ncbi:MAG TPA: TonB-dependent receptor [Novosphingobium sp.]|nr:TonB-dependent receptor [Novosphingobium sp.]
MVRIPALSANSRLGQPVGSRRVLSDTRRRFNLRHSCLFLALAAGCLAAPACADTPAIPSQDLAKSIATLARVGKVQILAPSRLLNGRIGHAVRRSATVEQALAELLAGTGLSYQRTAPGTYIIVAIPAARAVGAVANEPAIAEILVIGRRSLNLDIQRRANDVQPYHVVDRGSIERAQPDDAEDFTRTHLTMNHLGLSTVQSPLTSNGSIRSQINLRGLGTDQTQVLVDGRRLASVPMQGQFLQPDIRGLPTKAIQRIEVSGSSAGSIFGIGAAGGAINFVLDRDTSPNEITVRQGISERGDAPLWSIDAKLGYVSPDGGTHLSARISHSVEDGLNLGDRTFAQDTRNILYARGLYSTVKLVSNSINIVSVLNSPLILAPAFGGGSLNAKTTFLPLNAPALGAGGVALLRANAGQLDLSLSPDGTGQKQSLLTDSRITSVLLSGRQKVGEYLEFFVDAMRLEDTGIVHRPALVQSVLLSPGQAGNPFTTLIEATFPTPGLSGVATVRTRTDQILGGVIAQLGGGWSASADWAFSRATVRDRFESSNTLGSSLNLFSGGAGLLSQIAAIRNNSLQAIDGVDRLSDGNFRLSGPLIRLPGGPLSVTLSGETRRENNPGAQYRNYASGSLISANQDVSQKQQVNSLFAELRAPIVPPGGRFGPLQMLELQFAARYDRYSLKVPLITPDPLTASIFGDPVENHAAITSLTAGFRASPVKGVMFRASYASGYTPPTPAQIVPIAIVTPSFIADPQRGGLRSFKNFLLTVGGNPSLRPQPTHVLSLGIVLTPSLGASTQFLFTADFSVFRTSRWINSLTLATNPQFYVDRESSMPGRVKRAPLTAADAALGYTGGEILSVDGTYLANGSKLAKTIDFSADFVQKFTLGDLHIFAQASWEPVNRERTAPDAAYYSLVGHTDGALEWRALGAVEWIAHNWSTSLSAQYYGPAKVTFGSPGFDRVNAAYILAQGKESVGSQTYLDWSGSLTTKLESGSRQVSLEYRLSIKNLLNKRPPLVVIPLTSISNSPGYNTYGDPIGRRFELQTSLRF